MALTPEEIDEAKRKILSTPAKVKTRTAEIENRSAADILALEASEVNKAAQVGNPLGIFITKAEHRTRG